MTSDDTNGTKSNSTSYTRDNIYKRGDRWYVRFWTDGREIRRSAGKSRQAAQMLLARLRGDAERQSIGLPKRTRLTLADFAPQYMAWAKQHKRSWQRDERSLKFLLPALGHFRLAEITKQRVEAFMRDRREAVSGPSVNREVACLRKILSRAVEAGEIDQNPIRGIRLFPESPGRMPSLDAIAERQLLAACPQWLALMVRLAVLTGCRQGELLALRWRHVDLDGRAIIIEDSKSGEARRVPLHPLAVAELRPHRGLPDGYVIAKPDGQPPDGLVVSTGFRRAVVRAIENARKAGEPVPPLAGLRFHDLRHVAGTRLLATGASLPEVASFLGHKTLAMARRYAHVSWNRLNDLVAMMGGGMEGGSK